MGLAQLVAKGWPIVIELGKTMPGPPEIVWSLITDWEHQDEWMQEASDFVVTSPEREGLGVTAEATIRIGGISTRDKVEVVGWEPPRRLAIAHQGWVSGRGEMFLTPLGKNRTHFFWRETLEPPAGVAGALGLTAFRPLMERIFRKDLGHLEDLVRARITPVL
jgi:uncharacterized protein YndB with AHSA1/START domain